MTQFLRGLPGRRAAAEHSEVKEDSFFSESQSQLERVEACNDGDSARRARRDWAALCPRSMLPSWQEQQALVPGTG